MTGAPMGFTLGYRPALDGIRGVGVLIIMGAHSFLLGLAAIGVIALQAFFMLSGFLITVLLVREWERTGTLSLKHFYIRRALRLLPALVVFLAVATVVVVLSFDAPQRQVHYRATIASLFYFYNWAYISRWAYGANVVGHCWSLSIEEQFYLVWPLVLLLLLRYGRRRLALAAVALGALASMVNRALVLRSPGADGVRILIGSDMHADSLLLGCMLGLAACWGMLPRRAPTLRVIKATAFVSLLLLAWFGLWMPYSDQRLVIWFDAHGGQGLRVIGIAFMFVTLLVSPPRLALRILESPLIVWFGRRSYSIYLWHLGINAYLLIRGEWGQLTIALTGGALSLIIAAASFRWLEAPFLRMKTRFSSEPAAAVTAIAQTADAAPAMKGV